MKPQVVILAGGMGMRMSTDTSTPKPLVPIGDKPVLWHVMKIYKASGFNDFIICLGYKADMIEREMKKFSEFNVCFVDTGVQTTTGGRLKKIKHLIKNDVFFCTYADAVADISLKTLLQFHCKKNKIATISTIQPHSPYGVVSINTKDEITQFIEKPKMTEWINGGFFVCNKKIFDYIRDEDMLEDSPLKKLAEQQQLSAYKHTGFWKTMDTLKDSYELSNLWKKPRPFWKKW